MAGSASPATWCVHRHGPHRHHSSPSSSRGPGPLYRPPQNLGSSCPFPGSDFLIWIEGLGQVTSDLSFRSSETPPASSGCGQGASKLVISLGVQGKSHISAVSEERSRNPLTARRHHQRHWAPAVTASSYSAPGAGPDPATPPHYPP